MSLSASSAIVILVCRVYSPDGTLLCETAGVEKQPTTVEECRIAADTVRDTWNEINNYATWDAWAIACPAQPGGQTASQPASLESTVQGTISPNRISTSLRHAPIRSGF